jgi:hypothetical protein
MFFGIRNHVETTVTEQADPWNYELPEEIKTKAQFVSYNKDPRTDHLYFSCSEGINPGIRISNQNPIHKCYGIIADYDCLTNDNQIQENYKNLPYCPSIISRSFSGGVHAIWLFEEPVCVFNARVYETFAEKLKGKLKLSKFLPGLDERSLTNSSIYFESGSDWHVLEDPIPKLSLGFVYGVLVESIKPVSFHSEGFPQIPFEILAKEVEDRFPGRWQGEFTLNARGCRFWDEDANADSAIVKPEGMICYTGEAKFVPWVKIFGPQFVQEHTGDRIGNAIRNVFWDTKNYFEFNPLTGSYVMIQKEDLILHLRHDYHLGTISGQGGMSEVHTALRKIQQMNHIDGFGPFVNRPMGITQFQGRRLLNTYKIRPAEPFEGEVVPERDCPWLHNFFQDFFDPYYQLDFFFAWLKIFYEGQLSYRATNGHVMFVAGDTGQGKTCLSNTILPALFGASEEANSFLTGETTFNKNLISVPLWTVDDSTMVVTNAKDRKARWSAMLKKIAASREFECHGKFENPCRVEWMGRVMITCNLDPISIQIMPSLDISAEEKISALKVKTKGQQARGFDQNWKEIIPREIPYFARFLLNWQIPDHVKGDPRYQIKPYMHKSLAEDSEVSSEASHITELLQIFVDEFFEMHEDKREWSGTTMKLFSEMMRFEGTRAAAQRYGPESIGRKLTKLVTQGSPLIQRNMNRKGQHWVISRSALEGVGV